MTTKTTQAAKVATALVNAVISRLRSEGLSIYLNKRVSSFDGESYMKYMIGTPTKAVIAAGYKALRAA